MKRIVAIALVAIMACAFVFAGGNSEGSQGGEVRLVVGSGPIGGAFYPIAGGIAAIINDYVDGVSATVQVTAGGVENTRLLGQGELDIGLSAGQQSYDAATNSGMFAGENLDIKVLGALHASVMQIIVLADSDIYDFEDLKGKKVAIGEAGGGAEQLFRELMGVLGWTEDDVTMVYLPYDQAMDQLGDGLIDAGCVYSGVPASAVTNLASRRAVRMVNVPPETQELWVANVDPFLNVFEEFPAGTYAGMDVPATTAVARIQLAARGDLDEDLCYKITKALYENLDVLYTYHASATSITREAGANIVGAPASEGAMRYFKEAGLVTE